MSGLSLEERDELAGSVRAVCERFCTQERVREVAYDRTGRLAGYDQELWQVLCSQIGIAAIALPEHLGGAGYGADALGVVAHELGRVLAPVPLVASTVLATGLLVHFGDSDPDVQARIDGLLDGKRTAAAAITGDGGRWDRTSITLTAHQAGDSWSIDGVVRHVLNGAAADDLVVVAIHSGEPTVFLLDAAADGIVVEQQDVLDPTRPAATIAFTGVTATLLSTEGPVDHIIEHHLDVALAVLSAEQVGACERVLEIAVDYARDRQQFGRQIGSFQAVKHKCADMLVDLEWSRSASQAALRALDGDADDSASSESSWRASMAKAVCSEALRDSANANIQIHGGIGFTWEHAAHLYLRRARTDEVLFGSPGQHWDRLGAEAKLL
jgi:alkylation response protein AidB-like acyl-CoA dehydrogenase